ncbi:hypothetical protein Poli38472_009383 [Pythium oligandrum]|uniref:Uncharacterized protein n=1 Tax=Pythium oligandrum TaxID=41045 RepID=A0A8K1CM61_PYTOL|nr:hypothetical protein Poli38472_009383 [Pythium oligandrum]|eukprot:TMW65216.1 hypothetical protein Poli38472_009383 [Pythium oligandrum]
MPPRNTVTIALSKVMSLNSTQGSCSRYVAGPDGCASPRSCPDCLLTPGCMIDSSGSCVSQETIAFNESADFREAQKQGLVFPNAASSRASTIQTWEFPAYTTSYCEDSDPIC